MVPLQLSLLGPPEIVLDGHPVTGLNSDKVRALLFYLAVEAGRPHRRESLAGLLWPDYPERSARTNLSNALSNLRAALGDREANVPFFHVSRAAIQFNAQSDCRVDAGAFEELVSCGEWEEAIALYRGPFLEGFSLSDSPPFEQWALVVRERLQRQMMAALEGLAAECEERGDYTRAVETARRQLEIEPWHEEGHQALMRLLALSGQRSAALAQYEACARTLRQELDVAPGVETTALYEDIRDGKVAPRKETPRRREAIPPPIEAARTAPIPPAGERRWVTALHAEVHRAAALLDEVGPEEWTKAMAHVLNTVEAQIQRYGGEVIQRREEGVVALFGVPSAHEDDPERGVLAALGMQERTQDVPELRIGVDSGEVLVTYAGDRRQVIGRALTLARRASVAAGPGVVLVGENAYRLVRPLFEWDAPEGQATRGMVRPSARKALVGKGRGIEGLSSPLVGRDEELGALRKAVDDLKRGVGGIVILTGEAGIGKSRLMAEVRKQVTAAHHVSRFTPQWIEGRCLSYAANVAYHLWLDVLRDLLGLTQDASPSTVRDALQERVQALYPDGCDDVYPYLARLLSLPLEDRYETLRSLQGESLRAEVFYAVEALTERTARQRPLVVVCEDLHWADATSLALLERVLPLVERVPLLLLCVFRPETEHPCWRIKETAARQYRHRHVDLWLDSLTADESAALVGNLLRAEDLPGPLGTAILERAQGNPLYAEEILRTLIGDGTIAHDEATGGWRVTREAAKVALPDTLHGLLAARIDRLLPQAKGTLQRASVIGRIFTYPLLAEISPQGTDLPALLLTLERAQLIRERAQIPEREYIFEHVLTQEAAYEGLLKGERRTHHREAAEALERLYAERVEEQLGLLAHHWERAKVPERAVEFLLRAGEQARLAYANEEAIDYYRRALALLEDTPLGETRRDWRLTALDGLGTVYVGIGKPCEAENALQDAIALGKQTKLGIRPLVRLYYWLGESLYWQGQIDSWIQAGKEGLALLDDDTESVEAALMNQHIAMGYANKADVETFSRLTHQTAQFVHRLPYSEELRPAYDHIIGLCVDKKNPAEARQWIQRLTEKATEHHDLRALATAIEDQAGLLWRTGKLHESVPQAEKALELYDRIGDRKHVGLRSMQLGRITLSLGDLERAEAYARRYLEISEAVGNTRDIAWAWGDLGTIFLCQGKVREALDAFSIKIATSRQIGRRQTEATAQSALGHAYLAYGDHTKARHVLEKAITSLVTGFGASPWLRQDPQFLVAALSGLEHAYGDYCAFRAFCRRLRAEHPSCRDHPLAQWYLEPATVEVRSPSSPQEDRSTYRSADWTWYDPLGDCSLDTQGGLQIDAANGRDLWRINTSAPRLLRAAVGDLVIQATCFSVPDDKPAVGGLLLWADQENYIRLDWGTFGTQDVSLIGCVGNEDAVIGRGRLYGNPERVILRLERAREQVSTFCSGDGKQWFTAGHTVFPAENPIQVGMYATTLAYLPENIGRIVHPGAYPDGTAIRFESFQLWQGSE
jgi:DNA-binding SARP family transcriptional activator/regulation of enolase protein 1 (concanavalin A-like superfamily)